MAQVGKDWDLYRLKDAKVYELTADSSSGLTYGTGKDVPGIVEVAIETEYESVEFRGDDRVRRVESKAFKGTIRVRTETLPADVRTVIEGGTVTQTAESTSGAGDSKTEYLVKGADAPKYFKLAGLIPHARETGKETGKSATFNVYKAKLTGTVRQVFNAEPFRYEFEATIIPTENNDKLWDITGHENDATLT